VDHLATGCAPLDELLDGGLESDAITLVFGEGGSGKTNLALQCARQVALAGKRVGYVDTEGVSSIRLRQVFSATPLLAAPMPDTEGGDALVDLASAQPSLRDLESKVLFFTPYTIEEQERLVANATRVPDLGLLVVDSINMHYRLHIDTGGDAEAEASRSLYKQLHHLTGFARQNQVPVLVTGQVYGGEDATQPFARRVMEHLVKALMRFEKRPDGARKATILKHRSIEEGRSARFRIGAHGLDAAEP
jgi:DNA repair protein RadB